MNLVDALDLETIKNNPSMSLHEFAGTIDTEKFYEHMTKQSEAYWFPSIELHVLSAKPADETPLLPYTLYREAAEFIDGHYPEAGIVLKTMLWQSIIMILHRRAKDEFEKQQLGDIPQKIFDIIKKAAKEARKNSENNESPDNN